MTNREVLEYTKTAWAIKPEWLAAALCNKRLFHNFDTMLLMSWSLRFSCLEHGGTRDLMHFADTH